MKPIKNIEIVLISLMALTMQNCSRSPAQNADPKSFCLTDTMLGMIRVDTAKVMQVQDELVLTGKVSMNNDQVTKVFPMIAGNVLQVTAALGDYVKKGQTLAIIRSGDVATADQELAAAKASLDEAQKNLDAANDLYRSGIISQKEFSDDQNEVLKAKAEFQRANSERSLYTTNAQSDFVVKAPESGFIVEKNISEGMLIRPDYSNNIFTISALNDVWVIADVYEPDISKIKPGFEATITTLAYPGKEFHGTVDKVFNVLDPESKVMNARIRLDNPGYLLKPEMFANVRIRYSEDTSMIAIPSGAVIFNMSKNYVIVYHDHCHLEIKPVDVYESIDGLSYISSGLTAGDCVISKYQTLVFDAMNE